MPPPPVFATSSADDLDDDEGDLPMNTEDETIRWPTMEPLPVQRDDPPSPTPDRSSVPEIHMDITPRASPVKVAEPSPVKGLRVIEGVEIDREDVQAAIVSSPIAHEC